MTAEAERAQAEAERLSQRRLDALKRQETDLTARLVAATQMLAEMQRCVDALKAEETAITARLTGFLTRG